MEKVRVDFPLLAARCAHDDLFTSCGGGERDGHDRGRNERGSASGNVATDTVERAEDLSDLGPLRVLHHPVLAHALLGKFGDIFMGGGDRFLDRSLDLFVGGCQLPLGNDDRLWIELDAVEALRILKDCGVSTTADGFDDISD